MSEWKELNGIVEVAEAVAAGMEIEVFVTNNWFKWSGRVWESTLQYRARPRKPAMKKVKAICWISECGNLLWGDLSNSTIYRRFPAGDIEGEVDK